MLLARCGNSCGSGEGKLSHLGHASLPAGSGISVGSEKASALKQRRRKPTRCLASDCSFLTLLEREEMTRYAPLAGSPDIELNAAGTEARLAGGGPMRTETRPRARERSRHPLVLAGVVIVLLVVYSGWNWRPHPPHPPREFYGPPTLPPHLRHDGPVPGPASVRAHTARSET